MKTAPDPGATWRPLRRAAWLLACGLPLLVPPVSRAGEGTVITAVFSRASDDYARPKLPNGSFAPEAYAFGEGGNLAGAMNDASVDKLNFTTVARTIAGALGGQNYQPARDASQARLLIMVYWGTTIGSRGTTDTFLLPYLQAEMSLMTLSPLGTDSFGLATAPEANAAAGPKSFSDTALMMISMADRMRAFANRENAGILGYESKLTEMEALKFTPARGDRADLLEDIESNRYVVVLMAYDFQLLWKQKKPKLLWETRFSIREQGNSFSKQLGSMAQFAAKYFGQDSHGLVRKPMPEGHVELGELKIIEIVPEK